VFDVCLCLKHTVVFDVCLPEAYSAPIAMLAGAATDTDFEKGLLEFLSRRTSALSTDSEGAEIVNTAVRALAYVFIIIRPLIFLFLLVIVMSILAWPYTKLKAGARCA